MNACKRMIIVNVKIVTKIALTVVLVGNPGFYRIVTKDDGCIPVKVALLCGKSMSSLQCTEMASFEITQFLVVCRLEIYALLQILKTKWNFTSIIRSMILNPYNSSLHKMQVN